MAPLHEPKEERLVRKAEQKKTAEVRRMGEEKQATERQIRQTWRTPPRRRSRQTQGGIIAPARPRGASKERQVAKTGSYVGGHTLVPRNWFGRGNPYNTEAEAAAQAKINAEARKAALAKKRASAKSRRSAWRTRNADKET
jgi:hypothetical protein